ncbi:hypothetical protein COCOBI_pt-0950 (chloroplast) [Coccomyxa sp. Obi]|nr:hypothetical protein COCOBI_pt-0950 [Coccomyxa sp. Obi]
MKTYADFYTSQNLKASNLDTEAPAVVGVGLYFGIRLHTTFLFNQEFYEKLGFFTKTDIIAKFAAVTGGNPSTLKISQQFDLARLKVIRELSFSLIPKDQAQTVQSYGDKYNTSGFYAIALGISQLIADIYIFELKFWLGGTDYKYQVEPGSIKNKKSRKTTPNFL